MSLNKAYGDHRDTFAKQDRFDSVSADAVMDVNDNVLHVTGFSGAVAITLPPVANAAGQVYAIKVLGDASVNNVTVQDQDESRGWTDQACSNASGGTIVVYSDGEEWHIFRATNFA